MINRTYDKRCEVGRLSQEIVASGKPVYPDTGARFYGCNCDQVDGSYVTTVMLFDDITQAETDAIDALVAAHIPIPLPTPTQPVDAENKPYVRSEPRPLSCTTIFVGAGDKLQDSEGPAIIGGGNRIVWNAKNAGEFTTVGAPTGFKRKVIDLVFCDEIYMRAGYIFAACEVEDYLDLYVMCPPGWPYSDGTQMKYNTTGDYLAIDRNVVHFPLNSGNSGVCLDSGTASQAVPAGYVVRAVITIPEDDIDCSGSAILMMYRARTVVL
jgi:hypothetical protein